MLKVGDRAWDLEEVSLFLNSRTKDKLFDKRSSKEKKEALLKDLIFISLMESWMKKKDLKIKQASSTENLNLPEDTRKKRWLLKNYFLLQETFREELLKGIPNPSLKEQREFFNKNASLFHQNARCLLDQILINSLPKAKALKKKLDAGASFSKLKSEGGFKKEAFWVEKGSLDIFDEACFKENKKISKIKKSPYGYHILLVKKKEKAKKLSFSKAKKKVSKLLKFQRLEEKKKAWLKEELAKVEIWKNEVLLDSFVIP